MDYGKTGAAKPSKGAPRYDAHKSSGKAKTGAPDKGEKSALLARMKVAAEKGKS
ncbi:hypothetical protein [Marivita sp.]|jgi:hypothetical protein|uniref:hypothetical protein n=1 Tax=Marivita sp. TaxID=2003365 RepID=UPI003F70EB8B